MKINKNLKSARLDQHVSLNSDSRTYAYKLTWLQQVADVLKRYDKSFDNSTIMEIGAGVHNPLGSALICASWGCKEAVAVEPGSISVEFLEDAYITAALCCVNKCQAHDSALKNLEELCSLAKTSLVDEVPEDFFKLKSNITFYNKVLENIKFNTKFDIFHSNAVMEHVENISDFSKFLKEISTGSSIHIHKIDFIDHDYYAVEKPEGIDGFRFLLKSHDATKNKTCNRLRINQMIDVFTMAGFEIMDIPIKWRRPFPVDFINELSSDFSSCDIASLETIGAVLVLRG